MQDPTEFYNAQKDFYSGEVNRLKRQLSNSATLRFLVFIVAVAAVYFFHSSVIEVVVILILWISIFTVLVLRHNKLNYEKEKNEHLLNINQNELAVLIGDYHHLDAGKEFTDASHVYSYDIDLFGKGSFFQYLNRTAIAEGKKDLAGFLMENNIDAVELKQEAVQELSRMPKWRQLFTVLARMVKVEHPAGETSTWIRNYLPSFNRNQRWLPVLFSLVSFSIFSLAIFEIISFKVLVTWFFTGLGISGIFLKNVN
ncbi:MAG: DNA mismatch repair protein MutS, partial [Flavobacteriaceae bacterium]|nr:DNA mismatch repair protein MutS [Flavobacteriaceae bacterium]